VGIKMASKQNQAGFSLIELSVAMVIFLIVMGAVFGVLQVGNMLRSTINNSSETVNNARVSVNSVGRDATNAGLGYSRVGAVVPDDLGNSLMGIVADGNTSRDVFTAIMSGNEIDTSSLSLSGEKNDVVAFMFRDLDFNSGSPLVITGVDSGGAYVDLDTATGACSECNDYDLYLVESANGNHALGLATDIRDSQSSIRFHHTDPLGLNQKTNTAVDDRSILTPCGVGEITGCFSYTPQATVKRVFLTSYRVKSDGTLVRITFGNNRGEAAANQIQETPLANGVQRFQVRYLLQDGTFTDDPSNANVDQGNMNEIVQIEVSITIRPSESGGTTTSTQLINLSSTFSTRNIRYDVE